MDSTAQDEGLRQSQHPQVQFQDPLPMQTRQSRRTASLVKEKVVEETSAGVLTGRVAGKKRAIPNTSATKGKKRGATISPAIADVVFGTLQKPVPDAEANRRKTEDDAARCGCTVRRIEKGSSEVRSQQTSPMPFGGAFLKKDMTTTLSGQSPNLTASKI